MKRNVGNQPVEVARSTPGDLVVWIVDLDSRAISDFGLTALSVAEMERANRFVNQLDKSRFISTRRALRFLLANRLGCTPAAVEIELGEFGKPRLSLKYPSKIEFNVSHSEGVALISISEFAPVGVDIEKIRSIDIEALLPHVLTASEEIVFRGLQPEVKQCLFFAIWTAKEALLKASGVGFKTSPCDIALENPLDMLSSDDPIHVRFGNLTVKPLTLPVGFKGAIASSLLEPRVQIKRLGSLIFEHMQTDGL